MEQPTGMQPPTGVQRPTGVTILAILAAIVGVLFLLLGLGAIGFSGAAGGFSGLVLLAGLLALVAGIIELLFAYGAWNLRPWAWVLGVIGAGLSLVQAVLAIIGGSSVASQIVGIVIAAVILYYLNTPTVRRAFGRGPGQWFQS